MGKYEEFNAQRPRSVKSLGIHPIWRGVGFLFMVLTPLLSFAIADLVVTENLTRKWFPMPYDLLAQPGQLLYFAGNYIYIKLLITIALIFVIYTLFAFVTFAINSMFGISRYGPMDLPPVGKPRGTKMRKSR